MSDWWDVIGDAIFTAMPWPDSRVGRWIFFLTLAAIIAAGIFFLVKK